MTKKKDLLININNVLTTIQNKRDSNGETWSEQELESGKELYLTLEDWGYLLFLDLKEPAYSREVVTGWLKDVVEDRSRIKDGDLRYDYLTEIDDMALRVMAMVSSGFSRFRAELIKCDVTLEAVDKLILSLVTFAGEITYFCCRDCECGRCRYDDQSGKDIFEEETGLAHGLGYLGTHLPMRSGDTHCVETEKLKEFRRQVEAYIKALEKAVPFPLARFLIKNEGSRPSCEEKAQHVRKALEKLTGRMSQSYISRRGGKSYTRIPTRDFLELLDRLRARRRDSVLPKDYDGGNVASLIPEPRFIPLKSSVSQEKTLLEEIICLFPPDNETKLRQLAHQCGVAPSESSYYQCVKGRLQRHPGYQSPGFCLLGELDQVIDSAVYGGNGSKYYKMATFWSFLNAAEEAKIPEFAEKMALLPSIIAANQALYEKILGIFDEPTRFEGFMLLNEAIIHIPFVKELFNLVLKTEGERILESFQSAVTKKKNSISEGSQLWYWPEELVESLKLPIISLLEKTLKTSILPEELNRKIAQESIHGFLLMNSSLFLRKGTPSIPITFYTVSTAAHPGRP